MYLGLHGESARLLHNTCRGGFERSDFGHLLPRAEIWSESRSFLGFGTSGDSARSTGFRSILFPNGKMIAAEGGCGG